MKDESSQPEQASGHDQPIHAAALESLQSELRRLHVRLDPLLESLDKSQRLTVERVARSTRPALQHLTSGESRWPVSIAILVMIVLQVLLPGELTFSGHWVLPAIELILLCVLVAANPRRITRRSPTLRILGLSLIGVASLENAWSVARLIHGLLLGTSGGQPGPLLATGANIWVTNVIIFALWYWELDRGGPVARSAGTVIRPDLLFPQMSLPPDLVCQWTPEFTDYVYVSFTNATAFSPTDTMPLTRRAKMAMMLQAAISLVAAALVIARAVNILH